jgi:hypothetical protein
MGMYTDWGNLKIVSCEAWLNGAGPGSSTGFRWNGRVGGVHFWLSPGRHRPAERPGSRQNKGSRPQLGEAENIR